MRFNIYLSFALLAAAALTAGSALANVCQTDKLTCGTTMPVGGYCECKAHGTSEGGTVIDKPEPNRSPNATSFGCGEQPNAPNCR